ncbi:DUF4168 domain-containing protein [Balneolales bacterium ANBcel1]|nr:DUF4168 domain-containing protein [Balneolales bacterium ANBcel1]
MKFQSLIIALTAIAFACFAVPAQAQFEQPQPEAPQIEVSDDELEAFVDASMNAQTVQAQSQQEMVEVVNEEGIDVQTYNNIMRAEQMGESPEELDVSAEDMAKFESAFEQIQVIEEEMNVQLEAAVEQEGIDMDRFQEINMAVQQDPELQQRVQQMIQEEQMQEGEPGGQQY